MKLTNIHKLPRALVNAVSREFFFTENRYGVVILTWPVQLYQLFKRHYKELTEDAADRLFMLMGTAMHYALEQGAKDDENLVAEKKLTLEIDDITVASKSDIYEKDIKALSDYKWTSVWAVIDGTAKKDWIEQLNMNAAVLRFHGCEVEALYVEALLRDWRKGEALQGGNYPPIPRRRVIIPMMTNDEAMELIQERVRAHVSGEKLPEDQLPPCTAEDRWQIPDTYAVIKRGAKRAKRVLNSLEAAKDYAYQHNLDNREYRIEKRQGKPIRCLDYCPVSTFCRQFKELQKSNEEN